jgi:hypothetical protein
MLVHVPLQAACQIRGNRGKILQVAFEISADVAIEPDRPVGGPPQVYGGRRKSPSASQPAPVIGLVWLGGKQVEPILVAGFEQLIPEPAPSEPPLLAARHRLALRACISSRAALSN